MSKLTQKSVARLLIPQGGKGILGARMKGSISVMNTRVGLSFRPKACMRCGGDAYLNRGEDIEWVCLQCGREVPLPNTPVVTDVIDEPLVAEATPEMVAA